MTNAEQEARALGYQPSTDGTYWFHRDWPEDQRQDWPWLDCAEDCLEYEGLCET